MSDRNAPAAGNVETAAFGPALREEREQLGISLERLVAETKVQRQYLEAVEGNNFRVLPGGVFRRGIVRAYLNALHLEEQEWMPRFEAVYAAQAGTDSASASNADWFTFAENVKRNRGSRRQRTAMRWFGVVLLFLLLAAAAWAVFHFLLSGRLPVRAAAAAVSATEAQSGIAAAQQASPARDTLPPGRSDSAPALPER